MKIARKSPLTGMLLERDLPITQEQMNEWKRGKPIQDAMPHISADDREWLITGYTPEDWKQMFPDDGDDILTQMAKGTY